MLCVAVLMLEKDGKLSTDDPISKFFPDAPASTSTIKIINLMNHTSGLDDKAELPEKLDPTDRDAVVKAILNTPTPGEAGKGWMYSRRGLNVLAAIVDKASGTSYEECLRTAVFTPARMTSTGFTDGKGLNPANAAIRVSSGRVTPGGRSPLFATEKASWLAKGSTGVLTSLKDMEQWERVLSTDLLLSAPQREKLLTVGRENFALGAYLTTTARDTRRSWLGGASTGFIAISFRYIDDGVSMFVVGNETNEPDRILNLLTNALLPPLPESLQGWITLGAQARRPEVKEFEGPVTWLAERKGDDIVLKGSTAAEPAFTELTMSEGTARRILATIKNVRRGTPDNPVKGEVVRLDPGMIGIKEGGVTTLSSEARIDFRGVIEGTGPDGKPFRELRPALAVIDAKAKGWPLLVRMDDPASVNLYEVLSKAVTQPEPARK